MASTMAVLPIVKALLVAAQVAGGGSQEALCPVNDTQSMFIKEYVTPNKEQLSKFTEEELAAWADTNIARLNKILKDKGFSIQLQERPSQDEQVGVVSILDVMVKWLHEGEKGSITTADKNSYAAVAMNDGFNMHTAAGHQHPVISILTKGEDKVFMTVADKKYESFDLLSRIKKIRTSLTKKSEKSYDKVRFPMVDYDESMALSWLLKLGVGDKEIDQALQQTKFKMNEKGAHVKSAVAISIVRTSVQPPKSIYTIDKPFLVWIERPGVDAPVFAGYMDYKQWKDPGALDSK